jgi:hypothetical protein
MEVLMIELEFRRQDIEDLAGKLDSSQLQLSDHERALLIAIFAAARDRVRHNDAADPGKVEPTLGDLREQLLKAFIPGDAVDFILTMTGINPPK